MLTEFQYWEYIFYVMTGSVISTFFITKVFNFLRKKSANESIIAIILTNLKAPIVLLILVLAAYHSMEVLLRNAESSVLRAVKQIFPMVDTIRNVSVVMVITGYFLRVIRGLQDHCSKRFTNPYIYIVSKGLQAFIVISSVLFLVERLGLNINGLLTFGGIGGIAVGLAAKDLLSNFFGSIVIALDKPFIRGDQVNIPERGISGFVIDIGWRLTKVMTYEKRPIYIPNALFSTAIVQNDSRMSHRRINDRWRVAYKDVNVIKNIIQAVENMMYHHTELDQMQTILISMDSIGSEIFTLSVYAFTKSTDWGHYKKAREDIMVEIAKIVSNFDARLIFPEAQIEVRDNAIGYEKIS